MISLALHGYWKHIAKEKSFLGPSLDVVECLGVECRELGELSCGFPVGIMRSLLEMVVNASMAYMANISTLTNAFLTTHSIP